MAKSATNTPAVVEISKTSTNLEIMEAFPATQTGQPVLYAVEDHGIEDQAWGYFIQVPRPDPISGLSKQPRRTAMAISSEKLESGELAIGKAVNVPGANIYRELVLAEDKATSPLQNKAGEPLTSMGRPVFAKFFLAVNAADKDNGIRIDNSRNSGKVAQ